MRGQLERLVRLRSVRIVEGEDGRELFESRWPVRDVGERERMDLAERERQSAEVGLAIKGEIEDSVSAGLFDARPERHLVRFPIWVDEQGWREIHDFLDQTMDHCYAVQQRVQQRLGEKGGAAEGFPARVLLVSYEAPPFLEEKAG